MTKYLSGRSKVTPLTQLKTDRYQYLSVSDSEPNLGDPLVGPSSVGAKPIVSGAQYIIVAVDGKPGERYWIPNQGGIIPGSISIFDEGNLVGGLSSTTQLDLVGAAITSKGSLNPDGSPNKKVTITVFSPGSQGQVIFNNNNDFKGASSLFYDNSTNYVGVGTTTTPPTQELQVNGNLRLTGTIYDYNNQPGNNTNILVKNNFGGLTWVNQSTIRAGAGGTITNVQYHNNAGLVDGASNFVFDYINSRVGIGSTIPVYLFDVLGYSRFTGQTEIDYLRVTGIATVKQLKVENLTTTTDLNVTGYSTFASYIDANGGAYIDNIQIGITNDNTIDTATGDLTISSAGGTTFINNNNLTVTSGITSVGFITATTAYIGILTANILNIVQTKLTNLEVTGIATIATLGVGGLTTTRNLKVIGITTTDSLNVSGLTTTKNLRVTGIATFDNQFDVNNLNVSGIATVKNIEFGRVDENTISTKIGNLIIDSSGTTTQINDQLFVNDTTQSDDKDTGSIVANGGVGIEKNLNVGGQLSIVGITTLAFSGGITTTGGDLYVGGTLYVKTNVSFNDISAKYGTFSEWLKTKDFSASGISTLASLGVTGLTTTRNLKVIGISTFDDYIDANGGAYIDNIRIVIANDNTIDTSSGNITIGSANGTTILSDSNLSVTGAASFNGNVTLGNDTADSVSFTAKVSSSILPSTTGLDLGSTINKWNKVYATSFDGQFIGNADTATYATYAGKAGIATYADTAGIATYAGKAGIATYATNAGIATNLKAGSAYQIPYQTATDTTSFISNGTLTGQLLQYNSGGAPTWESPQGLTVGYANTAGIATYATKAGIATNLGSGTIYQIPYQSALDTTAFISTTGVTQGQLLQYNTNSAPSWQSPQGLTIGYANTAGIATYADKAGVAASITVSSDSSNLTRYIPFVDSTSGVTTVRTNSSLSYNPFSNLLKSTNISASNLIVTGIATIGTVGAGLTPNGTYDLGSSSNKWGTVYANTFSGSFTGTATTSSSVSISTDSTNAIRYLTFADNTTGVSTLRTNSTLVYNPSGIGSVGIATNNPKETLDIGSGDISLSYGDLNINGSIYVFNTRNGGGGFWSNGGLDSIVNVNNTTIDGSLGLTVRLPGGTAASYGDRGTGAQYTFLSGKYDSINSRGLTFIDGYLGIGTNGTPTVELQLTPTASISNQGNTELSGTVGAAFTVAQFYHKTGGNKSYLRIKATRNTAGTDWTNASTKLLNVTDSSEQGYIEFNPDGAQNGIAFGYSQVEYLRLLQGGNFGIGFTNPSAKLGVNGNITCNQISPNANNSYSCGTSGAVWSAVWVNGGVLNGSDQRDKTNITPSVLGLNFIQKLNPVSYKWIVGSNEVITDENGNQIGITSHPGKRTHYGLLSQEVKTAFEDCGAEDFAGWILTDLEDADSRQALNYSQFISPMIKAIQEQQETIDQLTTTVNSLLERIQSLESK